MLGKRKSKFAADNVPGLRCRIAFPQQQLPSSVPNFPKSNKRAISASGVAKDLSLRLTVSLGSLGRRPPGEER